METPEEIKKIIRERRVKDPKPEQEYVYIVNSKGFRVLEHRDVWERHNGPIPRGMIIHHKNGNKKDNRIENLQMMNFNEHMDFHKKQRVIPLSE